MTKRSILSFVLLFFILIAVFVACAAEEGAVFTIANGAEPETLDIHLMSGVPEHRIAMALFEGLVRTNPETSLAEPGVAESWTVSDDGTVYTFKLRETAWSDGVPITAHDFVKSWQRMLDPETAAPYAWFPSMFIQGAQEFNSGESGVDALKVRALDDRTFQFETIGPLPYVINALSHYAFGVAPLHAIEEHGTDWIQPENIVGNGPFVLTNWEVQRNVTVEPNPNYWDKSSVLLDKVVFLPVEEASVMYNMYSNNEIDWATDVPNERMEEIVLREDFHSDPQLSTYYYVFQTEVEPLNDARVRKALSLSIDRQQLIDTVTRAGQAPAYAIVPPMTGYKGIVGLQENVSMAQQLLAEAGYPGGEGFPQISVLYNTSENHKAIAEFIQQQWFENLGIDIELQNQEWGTYLNTRRQGDFTIARAGWVGDYPDPNTFLDMFVSGSAMNGGRYSSESYDALIQKATTLPDGPERAATLAEAEKLLIEEDMGIMPIYFYVSINLVDLNKWNGWYTNVMDYHPVGAVNN